MLKSSAGKRFREQDTTVKKAIKDPQIYDLKALKEDIEGYIEKYLPKIKKNMAKLDAIKKIVDLIEHKKETFMSMYL